jgi:sugar phosphate isomerase/epimerase
MGKFNDSRLILSAGTIPKASFVERVEAAKAAGFDAISLFPQQYLAAQRKEKLSVADMKSILADNQIALDEVDPLLDWLGEGVSPSETLMMEMADAFGARSVNVASAFVSDLPWDVIVERFSAVAKRAAAHGLRADLEFLPWTQVGSLSTTLKLLDEAAQPNAGVMFDFWHFFNSTDDLATLNALTAEQAAQITSFQLNDMPETIEKFSYGKNWVYIMDMAQGAIDSLRVLGKDGLLNVAVKAQYPHPDAQQMMKDALCSRLMPGDGVQPVKEVLSILSEKGVQPAIGIEVFNLDNYKLTPAEVAQRAMRAYQSVLAD